MQPNNKLIISIILAPDLGANTKADLPAAYVRRGVCVEVCVCKLASSLIVALTGRQQTGGHSHCG